jgi:hypothetical protein
VRIFITVLLSEQWFTENNSLSILLTVQLIENEFLNISTNYNYICLLGDFNARTAEEPDFVETNYDEFSGMLDIDNEGIDMLNELNIDIQRKSME